MKITPDQYVIWEQMILSNQIAPARVPGLLIENPEFDEWYRERANRRLQETKPK